MAPIHTRHTLRACGWHPSVTCPLARRFLAASRTGLASRGRARSLVMTARAAKGGQGDGRVGGPPPADLFDVEALLAAFDAGTTFDPTSACPYLLCRANCTCRSPYVHTSILTSPRRAPRSVALAQP